jgi:orotate phosphoribosyltransferase
MMRDDTAIKIADFLMQIKAIKVSVAEPFTWASGLKSPIYCDNRVSLSHPKIRTYIRQQLAKAVEEHFGKPDAIAGVATGAIAQGALVAEALGLPFVYVRSAPKGHGLGNLVEGEVKAGQSVIVIEDLVSTGSSSLKAVEALRDAGCEVKGMVAIFSYGFKTATDNFKKQKCRLVTLSNYETVIQQAIQHNYVTDRDLKTLKAWRDHPEDWSKERQ